MYDLKLSRFLVLFLVLLFLVIVFSIIVFSVVDFDEGETFFVLLFSLFCKAVPFAILTIKITRIECAGYQMR